MAPRPLSTSDVSEARDDRHDDRPIIVFDALCVLCSANAQFILKFDKRGHFRLASMQGEAGAALFRRNGIDPENQPF